MKAENAGQTAFRQCNTFILQLEVLGPSPTADSRRDPTEFAYYYCFMRLAKSSDENLAEKRAKRLRDICLTVAAGLALLYPGALPLLVAVLVAVYLCFDSSCRS